MRIFYIAPSPYQNLALLINFVVGSGNALRKAAPMSRDVHHDPMKKDKDQVLDELDMLKKLTSLEIVASTKQISLISAEIEQSYSAITTPLDFFTAFQKTPKTLQLLITLFSTGHRALPSKEPNTVFGPFFVEICALQKQLSQANIDPIAIDKILSSEIRWACGYFPKKYICSILPLYILDQKANRTLPKHYNDAFIAEAITTIHPLFTRHHHRFDSTLLKMTEDKDSPHRLEAAIILPRDPISEEDAACIAAYGSDENRIIMKGPLPTKKERIEAARDGLNVLINNLSKIQLATFAVRTNSRHLFNELLMYEDSSVSAIIRSHLLEQDRISGRASVLGPGQFLGRKKDGYTDVTPPETRQVASPTSPK